MALKFIECNDHVHHSEMISVVTIRNFLAEMNTEGTNRQDEVRLILWH